MSTDSPAPVPPPTPAKSSRFAIVLGVGLVVLVAGYLIGNWYIQGPYSQAQAPQPVDVGKQLREYLRQQGRYSSMDAAYTDADKDLVADPPKDGKFLDPAELAFTVVVLDNPEQAEKQWKPFIDHLAKVTGKPVKYLKQIDDPSGEKVPLDGTEQQLDAIKAGKLHVTAVNTGLVPGAVNQAGFVPLFCPADADGKFAYRMNLIVPAGSSVKDASELKGQSVAFAAMSSNSGGKAPLVLFKESFKMLPGRDYDFTITGDHKISIREVANNKHAAAAVASDLLEAAQSPGKTGTPQIPAGSVRVIYESKPFPPLCFGVPHNLDPKLRAKIEEAFKTFTFPDPTPSRAKFAPVVYAKDWEYVREIDDKLTKLLD